MDLPPGKLRRLAALADYDGRLQWLSLDSPAAVERGDAVAAALSGQATAVVLDPAGGAAAVLPVLDRGAALVWCLDAGPVAEPPRLREGWSVAAAARAAAAAVLVRLNWPVPEPEAVVERVSLLGDEAAKFDLPLVIQLDVTETPATESATGRGAAVLAAARALSAEGCQTDLLVLPLPGLLPRVKEFAAGALDGIEREAVEPLAALGDRLDELTAACGCPWLLSAEAPAAGLPVAVELAGAHGAAGFVERGLTWLEAPAEEPTGWLLEEGLRRWRRALAAGDGATPWFDHPRYGGPDRLTVAADWCRPAS